MYYDDLVKTIEYMAFPKQWYEDAESKSYSFMMCFSAAYEDKNTVNKMNKSVL